MIDGLKEGLTGFELVMIATVHRCTGQGLGIVKRCMLDSKESFQEAFRDITFSNKKKVDIHLDRKVEDDT